VRNWLGVERNEQGAKREKKRKKKERKEGRKRRKKKGADGKRGPPRSKGGENGFLAAVLFLSFFPDLNFKSPTKKSKAKEIK
jgi:hypothetical protein